jgi:hypothetical protein
VRAGASAAGSCAHRLDERARRRLDVLPHGELDEHVLERGVVLQLAEVVDAVVSHDAGLREDDDFGAELLHDFDYVGAEEDRPSGVRETADDCTQHQRRADIETGERLVEDDGGIVQQGGRNQHLLAPAFGERGERGVAVVGEPQQLQQPIDRRLETRFREVAEPADEPQVLRRREVCVEVSSSGT